MKLSVEVRLLNFGVQADVPESRQPPDILWREWVEGSRPDVRAHKNSRRMMVYRYNLMVGHKV